MSTMPATSGSLNLMQQKQASSSSQAANSAQKRVGRPRIPADLVRIIIQRLEMRQQLYQKKVDHLLAREKRWSEHLLPATGDAASEQERVLDDTQRALFSLLLTTKQIHVEALRWTHNFINDKKQYWFVKLTSTKSPAEAAAEVAKQNLAGKLFRPIVGLLMQNGVLEHRHGVDLESEPLIWVKPRSEWSHGFLLAQPQRAAVGAEAGAGSQLPILGTGAQAQPPANNDEARAGPSAQKSGCQIQQPAMIAGFYTAQEPSMLQHQQSAPSADFHTVWESSMSQHQQHGSYANQVPLMVQSQQHGPCVSQVPSSSQNQQQQLGYNQQQQQYQYPPPIAGPDTPQTPSMHQTQQPYQQTQRLTPSIGLSTAQGPAMLQTQQQMGYNRQQQYQQQLLAAGRYTYRAPPTARNTRADQIMPAMPMTPPDRAEVEFRAFACSLNQKRGVLARGYQGGS